MKDEVSRPVERTPFDDHNDQLPFQFTGRLNAADAAARSSLRKPGGPLLSFPQKGRDFGIARGKGAPKTARSDDVTGKVHWAPFDASNREDHGGSDQRSN
jgi:hypothetical protein